MEIYSVLLINKSFPDESKVCKTFNNFENAKRYILNIIEMLIEDSDISWYRNHGTRRLESFERELNDNWEVKPFDIYKIIKTKVKNN